MTTPRRARSPLALAILSLLYERSMHPYEMQHLMRERGHDAVIHLKGGSLYSTIDRLAAAGLIRSVETSREGRRPERTVYALTDTGRDELSLWLRELVSMPVQEYPWFGSAIAFLAMVPPREAMALLQRRAMELEAGVAAGDSVLDSIGRSGLPRIFSIETEYAQAMRRAELEWVRGIVEDIQTGALEWPTEVLEFQERKSQEEGEP